MSRQQPSTISALWKRWPIDGLSIKAKAHHSKSLDKKKDKRASKNERKENTQHRINPLAWPQGRLLAVPTHRQHPSLKPPLRQWEQGSQQNNRPCHFSCNETLRDFSPIRGDQNRRAWCRTGLTSRNRVRCLREIWLSTSMGSSNSAGALQRKQQSRPRYGKNQKTVNRTKWPADHLPHWAGSRICVMRDLVVYCAPMAHQHMANLLSSHRQIVG